MNFSEKKYRIVICSSGVATIKFINHLHTYDSFEIIGVIPDESTGDKAVRKFFSEIKNIQRLSFEDLENLDYDLVFVLEYRRLVPARIVNSNFIVNLHAGILPKYKGFSSNAWAIMNGESEIGYTIHRMDEDMDSGDIYFIKRIPITLDETYADIHPKMIDSILNDAPEVLKKIIDNKMKGKKQEGLSVYGTKFNRNIGIIRNFNVESKYLVNLYRCMAKPLGSGIYIKRNGHEYCVGKVIHGKERNVADYVGIPGRVVNMTDDGIWVKTKDNIVIFESISHEDGHFVNVREIFTIGCKMDEI